MDPSKLPIGTVLKADRNLVMKRVIKVNNNQWEVLNTAVGMESTETLGVGRIVGDDYFQHGYSIDEESIVTKILTKYGAL